MGKGLGPFRPPTHEGYSLRRRTPARGAATIRFPPESDRAYISVPRANRQEPGSAATAGSFSRKHPWDRPGGYSYFLEESRLSEQFLGESDGVGRNVRPGDCKGGNPLIGLCILSAETESMPPEGVLAKSAAVRASCWSPFLRSLARPFQTEPADAGLRFGGGRGQAAPKTRKPKAGGRPRKETDCFQSLCFGSRKKELTLWTAVSSLASSWRNPASSRP